MPDLNHNDPGPEPQGGWHPPTTYTVVIGYDPSTPRKLIFRKTYHVEGATPADTIIPSEPVPPGAGELLHHIEVKEDCYILIWLSRNADWHWQPARAITTAQSLRDVYFKLQYLTSTGWRSQPLPGETTRCIRFGARFRGGTVLREDSFNMNVMLENPAEGGFSAWSLPITIDPDIQNPRT